MFGQGDTLLDLFNINIEHVDENRHYWLVRTEGGKFYSNFIRDSHVAIGWNEFTDQSDFVNKKMNETIKTKLLKAYPDNQPGRIYSQIRRFIHEIAIGDVVMIPNESSKQISFGIVEGNLVNRNVEDGNFIKSRSVKWIKTVDRDELDPYLFKMMQAQQAINKADEYAHFIDRTMYPFYKKGDESFLILPVKKEEDIPAYDLSKFITSLVDTIKIINDLDEDNKYDLRDLDIKLNIQSPGFVELVSSAKDLIVKVLGILKNALTENQKLSEEVLKKTTPEKLRLLEEQENNIKRNFEDVKASLPADLKNRT
ncbi:restriction endonuclease [Lysinibacillus capsici]|uniref:restriction endonuclease n=1 Tax=Lysinibacillus capsici TaxID=2115968 RepID=UPI003082087A|nr:hypothetical protein ICJ70_00550 [Lysinibacillus capsici]